MEVTRNDRPHFHPRGQISRGHPGRLSHRHEPLHHRDSHPALAQLAATESGDAHLLSGCCLRRRGAGSKRLLTPSAFLHVWISGRRKVTGWDYLCSGATYQSDTESPCFPPPVVSTLHTKDTRIWFRCRNTPLSSSVTCLNPFQSSPHFFPDTFAPKIAGTSQPTLGSLSAQCHTCVCSCRNQADTFTQGERGTWAWMTSKNVFRSGRVYFQGGRKMWRVLNSTLDCCTLDNSSWCWRRSGICQ